MGPRIKNEIMRLCRSLLYMAAIYLCPAFWKRRSEMSGVGAYCWPSHDGLSVKGSVSVKPDGGAVRAFTIFGKVLCSLPISFHYISTADVFICQYQYKDHIQEFGVKPGEEKEPRVIRYARKAERSLKTGFDLLRLTLNLARGDLEAAAAH